MPSHLIPDEVSIHVEPINIQIGAKWNEQKREPAGHISVWSIGPYVTKGQIMEVTMQAGITGVAHVKWTDAFGNESAGLWATIWESSDPALLVVVQDTANGLMANVTSLGPVGHAQVFARTGATGQQQAVPLDVEIIAGPIETGVITMVVPEPRSEPAPSPTKVRGR